MHLARWLRAVFLLALLVWVTAQAAWASGTMMLRFTVKGPLDFSKVRYVMLFNTTGNGMEPYASPIVGMSNYSFAWVVGGSAGLAQPQLLQYYAAAGPGLATRPVVVPPQLAQLQINSTAAPGQFTLTFGRTLFAIPSPTGQKPSTIWSVNFITTDLAGNPIDANGTTGITDVSFSTYARINTALSIDLHYFKPAGSTAVSNPSAAITQNEVINTP